MHHLDRPKKGRALRISSKIEKISKFIGLYGSFMLTVTEAPVCRLKRLFGCYMLRPAADGSQQMLAGQRRSVYSGRAAARPLVAPCKYHFFWASR